MPVPRRRGMSRLGAGSFYPPAATAACEDSAFACRSTAWGKHDENRRGRFQPALAGETRCWDRGLGGREHPRFSSCACRRRRRELLAARLFRQPRGVSAATGMVAHLNLLSHQRVCWSRRRPRTGVPDRQNPSQSHRERERKPRCESRSRLGDALYTFATPVFGGQLTVGAIGTYGRADTTLAGTVTGALATPLGTLPFSRFDSISDSVTGFGDVLPIATLRWNNGVHNYMTYITGDIPVGAYDSTRLSNIGIGHGTIDAGGGYTYLNPQTGHEFTGVLGFTYNFTNQSTQYQNGVDMHFDWGASQFLTKQFLVGAVGYVYKEVGCDSGSGDRVGCFQSQVVGVGPQLG